MRVAYLLIAAALVLPCAARAQRTAAPQSVPKSAAVNASDSTSFVTGKGVYLRSTGTFIGRIVGAEEKHDFRAGHFRRPWMKAVLIARRDGPHEWVPVEGITKIYVTR
jgi:hypothetical protein